MAPPIVNVDSAETLRRFRAAMLGEDTNAASAPTNVGVQNPRVVVDSEPASVPTTRATKRSESGWESDAANGQRATDGKTPRSPTSLKSVNQCGTPEKEPEPGLGQDERPSSLLHISPYTQGIEVPDDTPRTRASSPRLTTHNEDVSEALATYVQNMNGRSLEDSMWAPKNGRYQSSSMNGHRSASTNLRPMRESYNRTTSQTLDSVQQASPSAPHIPSPVHPGPLKDGETAVPAPTTLSLAVQPKSEFDSGVKSGSPQAKTNKVLPHLRGRIVSTQSDIDSHTKKAEERIQEDPKTSKEETQAHRDKPSPTETGSIQQQVAMQSKQEAKDASIGEKDHSISDPVQGLLGHVAALGVSGHLTSVDVAEIRRILLRSKAAKDSNLSLGPASHEDQKALRQGHQKTMTATTTKDVVIPNEPDTNSTLKPISADAQRYSPKDHQTTVDANSARTDGRVATTSPTTAANDPEDREHMLFFESWGKREARAKPGKHDLSKP